MSKRDTDTELEHQAPDGVDPAAIAADWADDYPAGAELFCGTFVADDFDADYGTEHPGGETVAIRRCERVPTPGWIRRHAELGDMERTFKLIEMHASPDALDILDGLKSQPWNDFVEAWGVDGGILPKSNRSARRSASRKRPSAATS